MEHWINDLDDPRLDQLCDRLALASDQLNEPGAWPQQQLQWCGEAGVYAWFHRTDDGGLGWNEADIYRAYQRLASSCLVTTFVITQRVGACRRICSTNLPIKQQLMPGLIRGDQFATVGISHLTTSRRHLAKPILTAEVADGGFHLQGQSPWVTGSTFADWFVIGATMEDGRQLLAVVPRDAEGVQVPVAENLTALTASQTGRVEFNNTWIPDEHVLSGPMTDVMGQGKGAATGGLQTSALALGLAEAAVHYLEQESQRRDNLVAAAEQLRQDLQELVSLLDSLSVGEPVCSKDDLRQRANSLVLRSTQAALMAAKGTGYVTGHRVGRWCREALFFLVWSCPQPVADANLCEWAGIEV